MRMTVMLKALLTYRVVLLIVSVAAIILLPGCSPYSVAGMDGMSMLATMRLPLLVLATAGVLIMWGIILFARNMYGLLLVVFLVEFVVLLGLMLPMWVNVQ